MYILFSKYKTNYFILVIFLLSATLIKPTQEDIYYMYGNTAIRIMIGDITKQNVEAIVNAANEGCTGGGGVDGAIHSAAGDKLAAWIEKNIEEEPKESGIRCPTGQAQIAPSFNIEKSAGVKWIILTVGPRGNDSNRERLLTDSYSNSIDKAMKYGISSITFPAISTDIYGYNIVEATPVAIDAVLKKLDEKKDSSLQLITFTFILGKGKTESWGYKVYQQNFEKLLKEKKPNLRKDDNTAKKIIEAEIKKAKDRAKMANARALKEQEEEITKITNQILVERKEIAQKREAEETKKIEIEKRRLAEIATKKAQEEAAFRKIEEEKKAKAQKEEAARKLKEIEAKKVVVVKEEKVGKTTIRKNGKRSPSRVSKGKKRKKKKSKGKRKSRKKKRRK